MENTAQKKWIEKLTWRLEEKLPARKRNVSEKRHTENVVTGRVKLTELVKQPSLRVTELDGEVTNGNKTVSYLNVKFRATEKCVEDVVCQRDGPQACLQQCPCEQDKVNESITRVQDKIDRFNVGLKEDQNCMERRADEDSRRLLNDLGACMVKRVVGSQQTHFEASKVITMQYTSVWDCKVKELMWKLTLAVSRPVELPDNLKNL